MHIYIYIRIYICAPLTPSLSLFLSLCVSLPLSLYIYVYMHISIYIYIYIYWRSNLTKQKYPRLLLQLRKLHGVLSPLHGLGVLALQACHLVLGVLVVHELQGGVALCGSPPSDCRPHVGSQTCCGRVRAGRTSVVLRRHGCVVVCPHRCANTCHSSSSLCLCSGHSRGTARRRGRRSVLCHLLHVPLCFGQCGLTSLNCLL